MIYTAKANYRECKDAAFYLDSYQKHQRFLNGQEVEITKIHPFMLKFVKKVKKGKGNG